MLGSSAYQSLNHQLPRIVEASAGTTARLRRCGGLAHPDRPGGSRRRTHVVRRNRHGVWVDSGCQKSVVGAEKKKHREHSDQGMVGWSGAWPAMRCHCCRSVSDLFLYLPGRIRPAHLWTDNLLGHRLRSEEHTSELQSHHDLVCRLLLEK